MTYILLNKNVDAKKFEDKIASFVEKEHGENLRQNNSNIIFHLQPVRSIHLDSNYMFEFQHNGNRSTTRYLLIIAFIILVIAWINYINLSTARSIERAREVGIRKVMGGFRNELIRQFLLESLLINSAAVFISLILALVLTPWFGSLCGRELNFYLFRQPVFWMGLIIMIFLGSLLSGIYPAFVLSSHQPIGTLKGKLKNSFRGIALRKGLVVVQFIASIGLIIGTFVVYQQIRYLQNQSIGINISQTLVIQSPGIVDSTYRQKYNVFKHRLLQHAEVSSVSASTEVPGTQPLWNAGGIRRLSQREDESAQYRVIMMDDDFIHSYGLQIVTGRAFLSSNPNEEENVLMNEAACRLMGFAKPEDALDDQIYFWGDTFRIVGVLKNYGQESLKKAYDPTVYRYDQSPGGYYSVKFNTTNVKESVSKFENAWKDIFPGNPFDYFFLDEHYNAQYKSDQQFGRVFGIFSALAIFIACLGLFGLSSLSVMQRTKEIGIRKVLGAGGVNIIGLLGRDYLWLMGIAIVVAIPFASRIMKLWLQDFSTKITLSWWLYMIPCLIVILVAFIAISFHTLKAVRTDPVKTLRYE
jgi:putative ABC transport system permease protein